jgi:hypothetical protein
VDISVGASMPITAATCGPYAAAIAETASCAASYNPICPAGTTGGGGACQPVCPAGYTPAPDGCETPPVMGPSGLECPGGTTPVTNSSGQISYCLAAPNAAPTIYNEASVSFSSGAPHAFMVEFTGFLPTDAQGSCPEGTTYVASVNLTSNYTGPACAFAVSAEKKYLEVYSLAIHPQGACGESVGSGTLGILLGSPCRFTVSADGQVVLKSGVNCTDGSEPATGTDATVAGFPPGSVYSCENGVLGVIHVPMDNVPIHLTATNGFFNPTCVPVERILALTPTATPSATSTATATATSTATATPTSTPTAIPTATPVGTPLPVAGSPVCGPPGVPFLDTVTTSANGTPPTVTYSAAPTTATVTQGGDAVIRGVFLVNGSGSQGVNMFVTVHYPSGDQSCLATTGPDGVASCSTNTGTTPAGTTVPVDVQFVFDCAEFAVSTSFQVVGPGTPTALESDGPVYQAQGPVGICVERSGYGDLIVEASAHSPINTQPPLSTGPVTLGAFGVPTATAMPTAEDTAVPTDTPIPAPTNTPVPPSVTPTSEPSSTPTPTSTAPPAPPTATATTTPAARLTWSLDGARVQKKGSLANMRGITKVRRGQTVWLFVYYTATRVPKKINFYATYAVMHGSSMVRAKTYKGTQNKNETGRFGRYDYWTVPVKQPMGTYTFKATLKLGSQTKSATWKFKVVK